MKRAIAFAATAVLALGGCSGGKAADQGTGQPSTASPSATPISAIPTPTPRPTPPKPTPLTLAQAAKVYLAAVAPRNKTADRWSSDWDSNASIKTLRADAVRARAAERHFLDVLDKTLWPASVAKNAANLATCAAAFASWFDLMTRLRDRSGLAAAPDCGGADSQLLRARLGLSSSTG